MPVGTVLKPGRAVRALDDGLGQRGGGEIDLRDRPSEKRVAHRAADDARLLAVAVEDIQEAAERRARAAGLPEPASVEALPSLEMSRTRAPFSICVGT